MLIQVDKFYFPVDFIVLDTQPVPNNSAHAQIPVILGRPFLATSNAIINCKNGIMKLSFGNMTLETNIFNVSKKGGDCEDIREVDLIESIVQEQLEREILKDPLERILMLSEENEQLGESQVADGKGYIGLEVMPIMSVGQWTPIFEPLAPSNVKSVPSEIQAPTPERKPLPCELKYAFLGEGEAYPVVMSSTLSKS